MIVLNALKSDELRYKYIQSFVDSTSNYYIENIERKTRFCDGLCYVGYLWDCLIDPKVITESEATQILEGKMGIFIMWDIHSCERILIPNYWKYPKTRVLYTNKWLDAMKSDLPEDVYIFDDTFSWSVVFTHETDTKGDRYCIYLDKYPMSIPDKIAFR